MAFFLPLAAAAGAALAGLGGGSGGSDDKRSDEDNRRARERHQKQINAMKAQNKRQEKQHQESMRLQQEMLKKQEDRSRQQDKEHRDFLKTMEEERKREREQQNKLMQQILQNSLAQETKAPQQREADPQREADRQAEADRQTEAAARQAMEAEAKKWEAKREADKREFDEYKQQQENKLRQSNEMAKEIQRQASDMQAQNKSLLSKIAGYEQRQKGLANELEREVQNRVKQDRQHKQVLAQMKADHARAREKHNQEMKKFRREAKKSEKRLLLTRLEDLKRERKGVSKQFHLKFGEMKQADDQVNDEKNKLQEFIPELNDPSMKRIVLLGLTGDGKSTVANRLVGDVSEDGDCGGPHGRFGTSDGVESKTQEVKKVIHEVFGIKISVVDTPGISDSAGRGRDRQHITNVVRYLRGCGGVNQFLLTKNQSNPRLSDTYQGMLSELEHALGAEFWRFTTVLLTHVEGRRALRDFPKHRDELVREISAKFNCGRLEGVGIGLDDYEEVLRDIVTRVVPNERFTCDSLVSPLEELERKLEELKEEAVHAQQAVDIVEAKIRDVKESLRDIDKALGESASYDDDGDVHMSEASNKKRKEPDSGFGVGREKKKRRTE